MTKGERSILKNMMQHQGYDVLTAYLETVITQWQNEPVKESTEFETMWRVAQREAKVWALRTFINSLEQEAND